MKKYAPKFDIGVLLARQPQSAQTGPAEPRLVNYVMQANRTVVRARLDEIIVILERKYWERRDTKAASAGFLQRLARRMFSENRLDIFIELHGAFHAMGIGPEVTMLYQGYHPDPRVHLACARNWFLNEFYRVAGESMEHAMKFALHLLGMFAQAAQQVIERVGIGSGPLPPIGRTMGPKTPWPPSIQVYVILRGSAECPIHADVPMRGWLDRLIASWDSDDGVSEVLGAVMDLMCLLSPDNLINIRSVTARNQTSHAVQAVMELLEGGPGKTIGGFARQPAPDFIVPAARYPAFMRWASARNERTAADREIGQTVLAWFERSQDALNAERERWRSEIRDRPRRALRLHGADHVDIDVAPLRNAGVRGVIFHPEGCNFPDVRIDLVMRKETPHLMLLPGRMRDLKLEVYDGAIANTTHPEEEPLRRLLELVILDMMYRVMVEGTEFRPPKKKAGDADTGEHRTPVRPYVRALAEGHSMSVEAKRLADEAGFPVRPGHTFVPAHYRGGHLVHDLPTGPMGVYSDQDLFERGVTS